jgi:hypothetical protein
MEPSEIKAIDENLLELVKFADIGTLAKFFHDHGDLICNELAPLSQLRFESNDARAAAFFNAIKVVENGWDLLKKGLTDGKQQKLWNHLLKSKQKENERRKNEEEEQRKKLKVRKH